MWARIFWALFLVTASVVSAQRSILCPTDGIKYPDTRGDCSAYLICENGQPVRKKCDTGLNYHCEKKECLKIDHCCATGGTTTKVSITSTTTELTSTIGVSPTEEPSSYSTSNTEGTTSVSNEGGSTSTTSDQTSTETSSVCSEEGVKLPVAGDCKSYYQCVKGKLQKHKCSLGLSYNCIVKSCTLNPFTPCCSNSSTGSSGFRCAINGLKVPNPFTCNKYFECVRFRIVEQTCPSGQKYHWLSGKCGDANSGACAPGSIDTTTTQPDTTITTEHSSTEKPSSICPQDGIKIPDPNNCNSYYQCSKRKLEKKTCSTGLVYNCFLKTCTLRVFAPCCKDDPNNPNIGSASSCLINGVSIPNPFACNEYFECVDHKIVQKTCPIGQKYDWLRNNCVPTTACECAPGAGDHPTTKNPLCSRNGLKYPSTTDCSGYLECKHGQLVQKKCPKGQNYNCRKEKCEHQAIPHCCSGTTTSSGNIQSSTNSDSSITTENSGVTTQGSSGNPSTGNSGETSTEESGTDATTDGNSANTVTPSITDNLCPVDGALLPNPLRCDSYYICKDNEPVSRTCPTGEEYSCWDQKCVQAKSASCVNNLNSTNSHCSKEGIKMPNTLDCTSYYECVKGKVKLQVCDSGSAFNAWFSKCVSISLAHCESSTGTNSTTESSSGNPTTNNSDNTSTEGNGETTQGSGDNTSTGNDGQTSTGESGETTQGTGGNPTTNNSDNSSTEGNGVTTQGSGDNTSTGNDGQTSTGEGGETTQGNGGNPTTNNSDNSSTEGNGMTTQGSGDNTSTGNDGQTSTGEGGETTQGNGGNPTTNNSDNSSTEGNGVTTQGSGDNTSTSNDGQTSTGEGGDTTQGNGGNPTTNNSDNSSTEGNGVTTQGSGDNTSTGNDGQTSTGESGETTQGTGGNPTTNNSDNSSTEGNGVTTQGSGDNTSTGNDGQTSTGEGGDTTQDNGGNPTTNNSDNSSTEGNGMTTQGSGDNTSTGNDGQTSTGEGGETTQGNGGNPTTNNSDNSSTEGNGVTTQGSGDNTSTSNDGQTSTGEGGDTTQGNGGNPTTNNSDNSSTEGNGVTTQGSGDNTSTGNDGHTSTGEDDETTQGNGGNPTTNNSDNSSTEGNGVTTQGSGDNTSTSNDGQTSTGESGETTQGTGGNPTTNNSDNSSTEGNGVTTQGSGDNTSTGNDGQTSTGEGGETTQGNGGNPTTNNSDNSSTEGNGVTTQGSGDNTSTGNDGQTSTGEGGETTQGTGGNPTTNNSDNSSTEVNGVTTQGSGDNTSTGNDGQTSTGESGETTQGTGGNPTTNNSDNSSTEGNGVTTQGSGDITSTGNDGQTSTGEDGETTQGTGGNPTTNNSDNSSTEGNGVTTQGSGDNTSTSNDGQTSTGEGGDTTQGNGGNPTTNNSDNSSTEGNGVTTQGSGDNTSTGNDGQTSTGEGGETTQGNGGNPTTNNSDNSSTEGNGVTTQGSGDNTSTSNDGQTSTGEGGDTTQGNGGNPTTNNSDNSSTEGNGVTTQGSGDNTSTGNDGQTSTGEGGETTQGTGGNPTTNNSDNSSTEVNGVTTQGSGDNTSTGNDGQTSTGDSGETTQGTGGNPTTNNSDNSSTEGNGVTTQGSGDNTSTGNDGQTSTGESGTDVTTEGNSANTVTPSLTENLCPMDGALLPNPLRCDSYYICENNEPVSRTCPTGEEYSCWDQKCVQAKSASCVNNLNSTNNRCSNEGIKMPNTLDCTSYYECVKGKVKLQVCDSGTAFNAWFSKCVSMSLAHCESSTGSNSTTESSGGNSSTNNGGVTSPGDSGETTSGTDVTSEGNSANTVTPSTTENLCPVDGALLPNPLHCDSYYICKNNEPVSHTCPTGEEYSCWDQKCVQAKSVSCVNNLNSTNSHCSKEGIKMPNTLDCTSYYECVKGKVKLQVCDSGSAFNAWFSKCVSMSLAHCESSTGTNSTKPPSEFCPQNGITLPNVGDCKSYFKCEKGQLVSYTCPFGLVWNCFTKTCSLKSFSPCCKNDPHPSNNSSNCLFLGIKIPNPFTCDKYFECYKFEIVEKQCPAGKKYDWLRMICVDAKSGHCASLVGGDNSTTTIATTTSSSTTCPKNSKLSNIYDWHSYYECIDGKLVSKKCPFNLIFDCWLNICVLPLGITHCSQNSQKNETGVESGCVALGQKIPDPYSCQNYYECSMFKTVLKSCPVGDNFDAFSHNCKRAEVTKCISSIGGGDSTDITTETTTISSISVCPQDETIPVYNDCQSYKSCNNGKLIQKKCPLGLVWNCFTKTCGLQIFSPCCSGDSKNSNYSSSSSCLIPGNKVPIYTDCSKYYECSFFKLREKSCPAGQKYDYRRATCLSASNAICAPLLNSTTESTSPTVVPITTQSGSAAPSSSTAPSGSTIPSSPTAPSGSSTPSGTTAPSGSTTPSSVTKAPSPLCPRDGIRYPSTYPGDCSGYFECVGRQMVKKRCPLNVNYNCRIEQCDPTTTHCCAAGAKS